MNLPLRQYIILLAKYLKPHWRKVALLSFLLAANIGLQLLNPQLVRQFIDTAKSPNLSISQSPNRLITLAILFALTAILGNIASGLATYVSEDVAWSATNHLRSDLAQHTLALDMTFHKAHTAGEMIERIDGDVTAMSNFFSQFVVRVLGTCVLMGGVLVIMFLEDWRIGLAMTAYAILVVAVLSRAKNFAVPYFKAQRQASADLSAFWEERLSGLEDIRASGAEAYTMRQQFSFMRVLFDKSVRAAMLGRILFAASIILFALGNATAIASGASLLGLGALTLGTVYLIFDYTGTLSSNLRVITDQLDDLQRASAGIERVAELVGTQSKIKDGVPKAPPFLGEGLGRGLALQFHDVSFAYDDNATEDDNAPVLQHISFALHPGKVLGLLGRTGSGKTTLTRLLFRFYDPTTGHITLNDVDVRDLKLSTLRKRIGLVTQEVQLFQASVRDNLTFFDASISDERILQTLGELGLTDWLNKLSQGLSTELESGNGGLSAGEAQLLAFARVFLADPGLVVMDEASSRLDPATEQLIERAVDKLLHGRTAKRTCVIIAHHLGTVQRADDILILEDGQTIEYGARLDLIADKSSRFSQLLRTGLQEVLG